MSDTLSVLDGLMSDMTAADQVEVDAIAAASTHRLAAMAVRRTALRHPCTGKSCLHRNHRRDKMHAAMLLTMMELPDAVPTEADYGTALDWASLSKGDEVYFR